MTNKEKFKDICEKLECFDNPILKDYAKELEQIYDNIYGESIRLKYIVEEVAYGNQIAIDKILSNSQKREVVYARYLITRKAIDAGYKQTEIARAINANPSTIHWYLNGYQPPT